MLPIGVCAYAIPYSIGFMGRDTPRAMPQPLSGYDLLDLAQKLDLGGVEIPLELGAPDPAVSVLPAAATLDAFAAAVADRGLTLTVDTLPLTDEELPQHLRLAARLGVRVVRTMLSWVLCGDRAPVGGYAGWRQLLDARIATLRAIAPLAEDLDIRIGVENHQDATSDELVELCQAVGSTHVGITLDTGNPLAVGEDPVAFARKILPHLVHVHLKDYRVARSAAGLRLFHCAIGAGVVDFAGLFELFRTKPAHGGQPIAMNLEMAMLGERHIRLLDDAYWAGFGPRDIAHVLPVLRLRDAAPPLESVETDWLTPWDLGEDDRVSAWELERLAQSAANMRQLVKAAG
ncbi:MAG: sugar phosphate isomerase/epimerase family protein [Litorilinea sp.]